MTDSNNETTSSKTSDIKSATGKMSATWSDSTKPALKKFFAGVSDFYKTKIHPIVSLSETPEKRAIAAGRYLCRLSVSYAILSIIGAVILALISEQGDECVDKAILSDTCFEYATVRPYIEWAAVSLFTALIVASFLYAFGSYVEAKMTKQLKDSSH